MFTERRNIIISHHFSYFLHTVLFRFQQYTRTTHTYSPDKFYNRIVRLGSELLLPGGKLYFEINQVYDQETAHILEMNQYRDVRVIKDIFGKDRIVTANR